MVKKKQTIDHPTLPGVKITVEDLRISQPFLNWKNKCESLSGDDIGTKEESGSLYEQITQHVNDMVRRRESKNDGTDGAFILLNDISDILQEPYPASKEVKELRRFIEKLDEFRVADSTLNPRNTLFREHEDYAKVRGKVVPRGKKVEIYGHYRTPQFKAKTGAEWSAPSSWASREKNRATPPYYQALFGTGTEGLGITGLYYIIEQAIEDIEEAEVDLTITNIGLINKLTKLSTLGSYLNNILKNPEFYTEDSLDSAKIARHLKVTPFEVTGKVGDEVERIFGIEGEINEIFFDLSPKNVRELFSRAASRNPKVPENFVNPKTKKEVVMKWDDVLRA